MSEPEGRAVGEDRLTGERVRLARRAAGMTQHDCCRLLGMSRPTFIALERGDRPATPAELIRLAEAFGVQVSTLVADSVKLQHRRGPLWVAADLLTWTARLDGGDVSEGRYAAFVGTDRVTARVIAEACRAMARVVADTLRKESEGGEK